MMTALPLPSRRHENWRHLEPELVPAYAGPDWERPQEAHTPLTEPWEEGTWIAWQNGVPKRLPDGAQETAPPEHDLPFPAGAEALWRWHREHARWLKYRARDGECVVLTHQRTGGL
ncbi:MAG: hypothetical protein D6771_07560, partial [Zetaproteobacteria bacterium]